MSEQPHWADDGQQVTVSCFRAWMAVILAFAAGYGTCVIDVVRVLMARSGG